MGANDRDTESDLLKARFSATKWSRIAGAGEIGSDQLGDFLGAYWREVYLYVRRDRAKTNDEAKDLTQAFLTHLIEDRVLAKFRAEDGRLRTFLKASLKNFLTDQHRRQTAERRGGRTPTLSYDAADVERLEIAAASSESADVLFDREWAWHLLRESLKAVREKLEAEGKAAHWRVYELYDLAGDEARTGKEIAASLGLTEDQVSKHLARVRQDVRQELLRRQSEQVATEEELFSEYRELFGK